MIFKFFKGILKLCNLEINDLFSININLIIWILTMILQRNNVLSMMDNKYCLKTNIYLAYLKNASFIKSN